MISIVIGTNRPQNLTTKVSLQVEEIFKKKKISYRVIDIGKLPNESFTKQIYVQKNQQLLEAIEQIKNSKGIYILTPEYNGSIPGALKQFIDSWAFPDCWINKKVAFVGLASGEWGGIRPVEHLQGIFSYRDTFIYPKRVFIKNINKVFAENNNSLSKDLLERLEKQIEGFHQFCQLIE